MGIFNLLATPLGYVMEWIVKIIPSYGWALVVFTVILKVAMFPLSIKQQKSTARMTAYQAPMQEIQKKWATDKNRLNEEMMKFQQENKISMTAGCLPMALNMFVLFGLIQVIYYPLQYIFHIGTDVIAKAAEVAGVAGTSINLLQSKVMELASANPSAFIGVFGEKAAELGKLSFSFLGMDLTKMPSLSDPVTLILPIITVLSMIAVQIITTKMTGQEMTGSMKYMPWIMSIMFGYFCFTVPVAFSLYYVISNILSFVQSVILKKMYDPEKIKAQVAAEIAERRVAKKQKKQITVKSDDGKEVVKDVTEAELARLRLARARELDAQRYED
ncbi:MAG: YidC/Oxa1 family membrane protein insertase [Ruthenibacterium sp.]